MRPDIAQAIHDAAVNCSTLQFTLVEWQILDSFCFTADFPNAHSIQGRTFMLFVAEALS